MVITTTDVDRMREKSQKDREKLRLIEKRVWSSDFDTDENEIADVLKELTSERFDNGDWSYVTTTISVFYAMQLLNLKQQQKLVQEQKKGSEELVASTKWLAYATIALALITAIIGLASFWAGK